MKRAVFAQSLLGSVALLVAPGAVWAQATESEEIVVTASKTGQDVRDIAGSVSSLSGAALADLGANGAGDYLARVPGATFNVQQPGFSTITIRGVNTTASFANVSQGATGSYINDIPLTDPYFSAGTPDIDAFDVRNIEVHRGPQGTLFGSSSLGGAVNFIANPADPDGFDAALEAGLSHADHGDDLSSALRVMLNAPLVQGRLGLRAVGVYRSEAGFIDNLGTGVADSNETVVTGLRLGATLRLTEDARLSWLSLYQQTETDDVGYQNPDVGALAKATAVAEPAETEVVIHSLRYDQDLPFGTLTALVSRHEKDAYIVADLSRFAMFGFVDPYLDDVISSEGTTFEARLASRGGGAFRWLLGAMYSETEVSVAERAYGGNASAVADMLAGPGFGAISTIGDVWGVTLGDFSGTETALFGEASYTFADRLELTLGGRLFRTESEFESYGFGLLYAVFTSGVLELAPPRQRQSEESFNPKFALSYRFSPDAQIYALASRGFRFGGPNVNPDPAMPSVYESDSLWNYEVGVRGQWFDRRFALDASVFAIDWSDIQLPVMSASGAQGVVNAGDAEIHGAELALDWRLTDHLSWQASVTYLDAELTEVSPGAGLMALVTAGSQLPGASDWSISNVVRYAWRTPNAPFVQLAHRYADEAPALLQNFPIRNPVVGGYSVFDLRAGLTLGEVDLIAFANNVTDERAVVSATYTGNFGDTINNYVMRPRTIGLTLRWRR